MPRYQVTLDGKTFVLEGDHAPTEDEARQAVSAHHASAPVAPAAPQGDLGPYAGYKRIGDALMTAGKAALNHPVQSGAVLGGLAAAPFTGGGSIPASMAAAGLGAAGGAGIGSIVDQFRHGPDTPTHVAQQMATEGALGAAGEGVGQGVARVVKGAGKLIYKTALRPSMGLQREFGDVAATGLREGSIVNQHGAQAAADAMSDSASHAKQLVADAKAAGAAPILPKDVAIDGGMREVNQRASLRAAGGRPDERPVLTARLRGMKAANPNGIAIDKAQNMKGEFQDLASRVYRAEDKGAPVLDLSADTDSVIARGLRAGVDKSAAAAGFPGVNTANTRTQELMGLTRALEDATRRNVPGVGSLRSLLGDFMPATASVAGIGLDRVGGSSLTSHAIRTALLSMFGGQ